MFIILSLALSHTAYHELIPPDTCQSVSLTAQFNLAFTLLQELWSEQASQH